MPASTLVGLAALLLLVIPAAAQPAEPEGGTLVIGVRYQGTPPPIPDLRLPPDLERSRPEEAEFCKRCIANGELKDERLLIDDETAGVKNVAVSLRGVKKDAQRLPAATLDNEKGRFSPRVQFVGLGQRLEVTNSDPFPHNVRLTGRGGRQFYNALLSSGGKSHTPPFRVAGIYRTRCDLHPWMSATIIGVRHPFVTVTGEDGRGRIADIPPGEDHRVVFWHETLGTARKTVEIPSGKTVKVVLTEEDFN